MVFRYSTVKCFVQIRRTLIAAGHQPPADYILDPFEIFGSTVRWFDGSMVRWSSVTAALWSQRFA